MQLIQLLLPLNDNQGKAFPFEHYQRIRKTLTEMFGGLTAYTHAPAEGLWKDSGQTTKDRIVIFEIMTETLDIAWWGAYKQSLQALFAQDALVVRAQEIKLL